MVERKREGGRRVKEKSVNCKEIPSIYELYPMTNIKRNRHKLVSERGTRKSVQNGQNSNIYDVKCI